MNYKNSLVDNSYVNDTSRNPTYAHRWLVIISDLINKRCNSSSHCLEFTTTVTATSIKINKADQFSCVFMAGHGWSHDTKTFSFVYFLSPA